MRLRLADAFLIGCTASFLLCCGASSPSPATPEPVEVALAGPEMVEAVDPVVHEPEVTLASGRGVNVSVEVEGTLDLNDSRHPVDDSYYDEYTLYAEVGDVILVQMASAAFDAYLSLRVAGSSETLAENDDRTQGDTDSLLHIRAPQTGRYVLWANSYQAGEVGPYSLSLSILAPQSSRSASSQPAP